MVSSCLSREKRVYPTDPFKDSSDFLCTSSQGGRWLKGAGRGVRRTLFVEPGS
jgi:hypothetical protein